MGCWSLCRAMEIAQIQKGLVEFIVIASNYELKMESTKFITKNVVLGRTARVESAMQIMLAEKLPRRISLRLSWKKEQS